MFAQYKELKRMRGRYSSRVGKVVNKGMKRKKRQRWKEMEEDG
jgi:hypothetical protein